MRAARIPNTARDWYPPTEFVAELQLARVFNHFRQIAVPSRDVAVPVTITQSGPNSTATGSFVVKRLDHAIGQNEWTDTTVVANDVQVKFKLTFTGLGAL